MLFLSPKIFGQLDMILRDVRITIRGILEVLKMSNIFEFLIYTDDIWVWLLIVLKKEQEDRQRDKLVI